MRRISIVYSIHTALQHIHPLCANGTNEMLLLKAREVIIVNFVDEILWVFN